MPIPLSDLLKAQKDMQTRQPPEIEPDLDALPRAVSFGLLGHGQGVAVRLAIDGAAPQTAYLNAGLALNLAQNLIAAGRQMGWLDRDGIITATPGKDGRKG